jgi:membrane protease subunit HflK
MYIDTMQEVYTNVTKVLVDQKANNSSLLYLPLDKLIQQVTPSTPAAVPSSNTVANTPSSAPAPVSTATPATTNSEPRRDSNALRSRDRER